MRALSKPRQAALDAARAVIKESGIVEAPVPVERIVKSRGISIRYAPLENDLSGMAFIKDSVGVIAVNALHHPNRQRFTIAHEFAHHVLHREVLEKSIHVDKAILKRDMLAAQGTDEFEIQANIFASELLMPRELIASIVGLNVDLNDESRLMDIARRFKVSIAALQLRLASFD